MADEQKIVGNCPQCGAPIYSSGSFKDGSAPRNSYSCDCRNQKKTTQTDNKPLRKYGAVGV